MKSISELSDELTHLLDAWYLMRIISLMPTLISKRIPQVSFTFSLVSNLLKQFIYAKDVAPITKFALEKKVEYFNDLFQHREQFGYSINSPQFTNMLLNLDRKKGVFLTAHWLLYIFDYQEKTDYIWAHFPLFYSMAKELESKRKSTEFTNTFIYVDRLKDPWTGQRLTHRFYKEHKLNEMLAKTVKILCEYDGSLIVYIDELLKECSCINNNNWIRLIAAALNSLTYESYENKQTLCQYAEEKHFLIKHQNEPWKIKTGGEKRLWAALRDYIFDPYFRRLFINILSNNNPIKSYLSNLDKHFIANEKYLSQLELPGDIWNEQFLKYHLNNFKTSKSKFFRKIFVSNSRISARRLYSWLLQQDTYNTRVYEEDLYPIYLDATFILRKDDLNLLMKNSRQIKSIINNNIGDLHTEEDVIRAHDILRKELQKMLARA